MVARQPSPLLQAMYYGPVIDRTGRSCSASDLQARSPRRRGATSESVADAGNGDADAAAPATADEEILLNRDLGAEEVEEEVEDQAYVVLLRRSPASSPCRGASCHAGQRPGRRRIGGNAIRILLVATAAAFLALAVTPVSCTSNKKEEEMAAASTVVTEESTGLLGTRSRTGSDPGGGIDLLAALQLHNTTRQGVTQVPGLVRLKPAYYLQGEERELRLNEATFERAAALLRRVPEFTIAAALRQEEANSGTIVAFSHGNNRYLELQSSGRKDELRLHYVSRRDGTVHVEAFPFRLADGAWHRVALSISGSQVELLVDCHPLYRRLLRPGPPDTNFTLPQLQLWIGQRNTRHFLFKGALQDVKLIPEPHGYLSQCPQLDSSCPTCGQFSILQNTVEQLMHNLNELTRRLAAAEGRISKVEECECQKSCRTNGTVHEDGATWEKGCQQCSCVHGEIECRPTPCAPVTCKNPVVPLGQCCPICLKQCYLHGVIYDHGEKVSPKQCVECDCFDGSFTCQRFDTETKCPSLPCPPNEQISVAEECCKFCPGVDYCAKGHKCHSNASCLNLQTTYACHCDIGFQGDGHVCHDVDECKQQGGSEGHHCNANTRCVNVIGSYTCECLPGYHRVDKFNCAELDECATGHHACDEHATCINTAGSYYCICKDGYSGDGYTCKPVCNQTCQNGGECVAPGRCSCRRGYIGNSCELDLDECASDLHRCHHSSTCFNMPGWYYCRCKPGYRSALHDSTQGTQCLDIDECNDQTIERRHTCHPSAKCVNTEGSYECVCPRDHNHAGEDCRLSCWFEGREINNSETFAPAGNPCRRCTCADGVISCRDPICDCSAPGSHRDKCCPQCDPAASCRHQELHHLVFRSGERWIYQCQTCECLYGEIDCWQMECPPVTCPNPVTEDGDCCPRCEDDPCAREVPANGTSLSVLSRPRPCSYAGIIHDSSSSWQDPHDKCTTCECKDGQLCCSYDYGCAGDLGDNEQHRPAIAVHEPAVRGVQDPGRASVANRAPEAAVPAITGAADATAATSGPDAMRRPIAVTAFPVSAAPGRGTDVSAGRKSHPLQQQASAVVRGQQRDERRGRSQAGEHRSSAYTTARHQQSARGSTISSVSSHREASPTTASTPKATASMAKSAAAASAWSNTLVGARDASKPATQGQQSQWMPSQRDHLSAIKPSTATNAAVAPRTPSFPFSSPFSPPATSSSSSASSASSPSTSPSVSSPPVTMVPTSSMLVDVNGVRSLAPGYSNDDRDKGERSVRGDSGDRAGGDGEGVSVSSSVRDARQSVSLVNRGRRKDDTNVESVARDSAT